MEMRVAADVIWRVPEEIDGHEVPQELRQRCEAVLLSDRQSVRQAAREWYEESRNETTPVPLVTDTDGRIRIGSRGSALTVADPKDEQRLAHFVDRFLAADFGVKIFQLSF